MGWFSSGSKDTKETELLLREAVRLRSNSFFHSQEQVNSYLVELLVEVCAESDLCISAVVAQPLGDLCLRLIEQEPFLYTIPDEPNHKSLTLKEAMKLREELRHAISILSDEARFLELWRHKLKSILIGIVGYFPVNCLVDPYPDGTIPYTPVLCPHSPLSELIDDLPTVLFRLIVTIFDEECQKAGIFKKFQKSLENRVCIASGIPLEEKYSTKKKMILPNEKTGLSANEISTLYTNNTLLEALLQTQIPIPIPPEIRFEHTHIVGGTGHGKTQLLQYLIADDLHRALDEDISLVVFDPDGTLIRTITQTDYFGEYLFRDRAIFIDPTDTEHPVGLNLFDVGDVPIGDTRALETIQNNTIELFEYFFDALLGSELTGRQSTLFRYLGLLLMQIPNANIHTLRELLEDPTPYKKYFQKLTGSARIFFETRFLEPSMRETKRQIVSRLWGILSSQSLDRIFSSKRNTVNFDEALSSGKMIFIHTSKEYLGEEGSHIFSRLMVALIGQSIMRRAALPPDRRNPTYIYIDEAEGVVDKTLVRLLANARKYRCGIAFAHQHIDQLSTANRAGVLANTSIKLAGGISAKDAGVLAPEYRCRLEYLLSMKREKSASNFALFAKNVTPSAMQFSVPLGYAEGIDRLSSDDYGALIESSQQQTAYYELEFEDAENSDSVTDEKIVERVYKELPTLQVAKQNQVEPESIPEPKKEITHRKEGGGGIRHSQLEMLVKELGEAASFRVGIEETILDGAGRVDVILRRDDVTILVEVSVTTTREHEYLNIQKCLEFGGDEIWLLANTERHRISLERFISARLSPTENAKVRYILENDLTTLFQKLVPSVEAQEKIVRGYKVRSKASANEQDVAKIRKEIIEKLIW